MQTSEGRLPDASTDRASALVCLDVPHHWRIHVSRAGMRPRLAIAAAAVAAGAAVAAPAASAATVPVASGVTNLHLNAATAGVLTDAGLAVAPVGPAKASGLRVSFPVTGGAIDPATAVGRVAHSGGLAFSSHGSTVRLTNFVVR